MPDEGESEEDRQEYYTESIQDIIDKQKEQLGEETAIKWARRAPIKISPDGEVQGFYGKGEDALETLRDYTEHEEFYLEAIQSIIDTVSSFMGDDVGLKFARKAPLQIMPNGEVQAYFGTGRKALTILIENYEDYMGKSVADQKIKSALSDIDEDKRDLVPERVRPEKKSESDSSGGLISKIFGSGASVLYAS
ncbi:MAG: hypothetical protein ABEJ95_06535 [Candidatus Nanohalobium sp.]